MNITDTVKGIAKHESIDALPSGGPFHQTVNLISLPLLVDAPLLGRRRDCSSRRRRCFGSLLELRELVLADVQAENHTGVAVALGNRLFAVEEARR